MSLAAEEALRSYVNRPRIYRLRILKMRVPQRAVFITYLRPAWPHEVHS